MKLINKKYLNYKSASNYCKLLNGNLFEINSFDDNFKLNLYVNNKNGNDIWLKNSRNSLFNIKKQQALNVDDECLIKRGNNYFYENCNKNLQFICEFNIKNEQKSTNRIKLSCGQTRGNTKKATVTVTSTKKTTVLPVDTTKGAIVILENEVVLDELKQQEQVLNTNSNTEKITKNFKNTDFGK